MIKYSLVCDEGHTFESWFADSDAYDTQARRGFVECPACGSKEISKALMAPAVSTSRRKRANEVTNTQAAAPPEPVAAPQPVALMDERQQAVRAMIRDLHQKMTENSTDVGENFPREARRMQDGETPKQSIHGKASLEEAKALIEEGISVLPLPSLPDERN